MLPRPLTLVALLCALACSQTKLPDEVRFGNRPGVAADAEKRLAFEVTERQTLPFDVPFRAVGEESAVPIVIGGRGVRVSPVLSLDKPAKVAFRYDGLLPAGTATAEVGLAVISGDRLVLLTGLEVDDTQGTISAETEVTGLFVLVNRGCQGMVDKRLACGLNVPSSMLNDCRLNRDPTRYGNPFAQWCAIWADTCAAVACCDPVLAQTASCGGPGLGDTDIELDTDRETVPVGEIDGDEGEND